MCGNYTEHGAMNAIIPILPSFPTDISPQARLVLAGLEVLRRRYEAERPAHPDRRPVVALTETIPILVERDGVRRLCRQPVFEITGWEAMR